MKTARFGKQIECKFLLYKYILAHSGFTFGKIIYIVWAKQSKYYIELLSLQSLGITLIIIITK